MSKTKGKKILSLVLALCMVLSLLPATAFAAVADPTVAEVSTLDQLKEAITQGDKNTIKLTANITGVNETIVINRGLTLDLNGNTISGAVTPITGIIQATAGDVTIKGPGTIKNTGTTTTYKPGLWDVYNGSIVAVSASNKAVLTLDGGVVLESASPSTDINTGILYADNARVIVI